MTPLELVVFWAMASVFGICIAVGTVLLMGWLLYRSERRRFKRD
jgi:hypothetical protein